MKALFVTSSLLLTVVLLASFGPSAAGAGLPLQPKVLPGDFAIQTDKGYLVTAVGGGGRTQDAIHTDAVQIHSWERFKLVDLGGNQYAVQTANGHYLTAVDGGGRTSDVVHTDATKIGSWERFRLYDQGDGSFAFQTTSTKYLTAVGGGGQTGDVVHTDAVQIGSWERFKLMKCGDLVSGFQYSIRWGGSARYLTAVGGGGRTRDVIQVDSLKAGPWEGFTILRQGDGSYAIQTASKNYVTAVGGGGLLPGTTDSTRDVLHTDATKIGSWERFRLLEQGSGDYAIQTTSGKYLVVLPTDNSPISTAADRILGPQFSLMVVHLSPASAPPGPIHSAS
jgi:hypothetical protein